MDNASDTNAKPGSKSFMRRSLLIGAVALLLGLATGCRYTAAPADLLQKPAIAPEKQAIVQAIEKSLPDYSKLTLPMREDHMEAIRLIDVDGDGIDEAIVSYYNEYSSPELMVFKYTSMTWKPWVLVQQPLARVIDWLKIEDLDKDGQVEIMIGWIGAFDSPNVLEIYSFSTKPVRNDAGKLILKPVETLPYSYGDTGDINGDGRLELAIISEIGTNQEMAMPEFHLTLYNWRDGGVHKLYTEELYNDVNNYDRLLIGRISTERSGIILEASTGAHSTYTTMYAWDRNKLKLVYPAGPGKLEGLNGTPTMSKDMDGDGILEIPWAKEAPGYPDISYAESKWLNEWMQWDGKVDFVKISEQFTDYRYGIQLRIPDPWMGRYTLHNPEEEFAFVAIDYWNEAIDLTSALATLYAVPQKQWESVEAGWKQEGKPYRQLMTDSGNVFAVSFVKEVPEEWEETDRQAFKEMAGVEAEFTSSLSIRND
ncbi:VCBS repeat-containing protein [Paenibacillus sinopodophylli]|uniref:VCBS repeat-containing protein n=1 Tax=Paenibacillus sinopodophylli TaxID=1837342 RepID=UPI00110CE276|nr:VCBS repeat-containing protein [Paenibacillus sinopodophylli]